MPGIDLDLHVGVGFHGRYRTPNVYRKAFSIVVRVRSHSRRRHNHDRDGSDRFEVAKLFSYDEVRFREKLGVRADCPGLIAGM